MAVAGAGVGGWQGTDSLEKDNERPRMINHQYKAKCKSLRVPLAAYKETLISYTGGQRKLRIRPST